MVFPVFLLLLFLILDQSQAIASLGNRPIDLIIDQFDYYTY